MIFSFETVTKKFNELSSYLSKTAGLDINDENNDDQQMSSKLLTADDVILSQIFTFILLILCFQ